MVRILATFASTILALGLTFSSTGLAAQSLSLDSSYAWATRNYPLIKQYDLIEKSKEYTLSNASKAYLPQLSVTAIGGYLFSSGRSDLQVIGVAQLNQSLWDGGAAKAQKNIITAASDTEKASLDVSLYELRSRISQVYFGILLIDEHLTQLAQHEAMLNNNANRIRKMNENGLAFQTDLDEITVEQLKLTQKRIEYNYARRGYLQVLSLFLGREVNDLTTFERPRMDLPVDTHDLLRPEMKLFESQRALIDAEDEMRKVAIMPRLGIMGAGVFLDPGVALGPTSLSSLGVVGLSASWSVSGLYKNANQRRLNQIALRRVNVQQESFVFNNKLQTTQSQADIQKQQAILAEDRQIVELRKRIREGYQVKYDNGIASLLDLLDATEKENEAQTQTALHEMQLLMTIYENKIQTGNN